MFCLQDRRTLLNDQMDEEIRLLEEKYEELKQPLYDARLALIRSAAGASDEQKQKFETLREEAKKVVEENNGEVEEVKVELSHLD